MRIGPGREGKNIFHRGKAEMLIGARVDKHLACWRIECEIIMYI